MVRIFIILFATSLCLNAGDYIDKESIYDMQIIDTKNSAEDKKERELEDTIISFMGNKTYSDSKNLVLFLFSKEVNYYKNDGAIDKLFILEVLKTNGLIELFTKKPEEIELIFSTKYNPLLFMRIVSQALNSMGYSFFLTKRISRSPVEFVWHITIQTQNIPNPVDLNENLKLNGSFIEDIKKDGNVWSYEINSQSATINAQVIPKNIQTDLKKPLTPYWVRAEDMSTITLKSHPADSWHPKISFFDKNLNLVDRIEIDSRRKAIKLTIPQDVIYIKIEDLYILDNIKRGLSVTLS